MEEFNRIGKNIKEYQPIYENLLKWVLTAETYMHVDDWKKLFDEIGFNGDYYWFIP